MSKLCERLRQLRAECHMTQGEVAEQLHMTRQAVSSYESGRTEPDLETLKQLAEIYGVTLEELLGTEEAGGKSVRRSLWILRGTNGVILLCSLVRSALLWIADRFYPVESGMVTPEMAAVVETRFAIKGVARGIDSAVLAMGWWLGMVVLVLSVRRLASAKALWKELGFLTAGMLLVSVPWDLADCLLGFWNYDYIVISVLFRAVLFLGTGLLIEWLLRKRI